MAIADRINEMYTHVGDVYDTITNVDLPTNKNIQNIPQTIKDSYLEIMNNGIDTIWNNWEKVTGSGTSISLSPTLKAPMKNELKGNTSQTGTPTPTSPIDVNVVSGNNEIVIANEDNTDSNTYNIDLPVENLFDKANISWVRNNNADYSLATDNSDTRIRTMTPIKLIGGKTYTLSGYPSSVSINSIKFYANLGDTTTVSTVNTSTFTVPTNATYVIFQFGGTGFTSATNTLMANANIMLEKGSKANTYTPFGTKPIELCKIGNYQDYFAKSDGTNLFDKSSALLNKMAQGNGNIIDYTGIFSSDYIKVQPSTSYYVNQYAPVPIEYDKNKNVIGYSSGGNSGYAKTFTTSSNCQYVRIRMFDTTYSMDTALNNAMLSLGSSATPWQPYGVGKWYLHKEIGKVVLNGSETWAIFNSNNTRTAFRTDINDIEGYTNGDNTPNLLSNRFIPISYNGSWVVGKLSRLTQSNVQKVLIVIYNPNTSVEDFKAWLSTNNVVVYYVLATPTNTEITDTTLINQLEQFYQAQSKNNQTNISQINNDLGFIISASALKKG